LYVFNWKVWKMSQNQVDYVSWIAVYTLLAVLTAVGICDLYLVRVNPDGPTVSRTVWGLAKEYPIVTLLAGILLGHLFWPQVGR
jgi:hypothetical protein